MLLLHQSGSVKVGEVVRYKLTYTPAVDRILPPPTHLHVKIKNASAIPLRAAYLHGPYTVYVAAYPTTFDPNSKFDAQAQEEEGVPDYEPQLKAGGHWSTKLKVPERLRQDIQTKEARQPGSHKSVTWVIEVASQVLFSKTAAVHFELLVGRDENSVASRLTGVVALNSDQGLPGKLEEFQEKREQLKEVEQTKGVFSKAIKVMIEDTESLWNLPPFPSWDANKDQDQGHDPEILTQERAQPDAQSARERRSSKRQKKLHLVVLTHGIHSNLGADMLYLKESVDAAAKKAKEDARRRRAELRLKAQNKMRGDERSTAELKTESVAGGPAKPEGLQGKKGTEEAEEEGDDDDDDDDEEVIVRGFNGNAVKTEKGIQYLGKRLAKYVLSATYPDQPYLPVKSSISKSITRSLTGQKLDDKIDRKASHKHSTIIKDDKNLDHDLPYRITSISFIGHSLGGLVQTYAVAYIQKHSPEFFDRIKPINFVAMATPFLGLSNENPMYVRFALDFGLVGRTGQDLGLTWRAPNIARSGWGAMVNGLVNDPHKDRQPDPGAKPLLRILPTGPAHVALKKFRNRTVYSNVVNDGIVPLRTSCLLFLDWRGLDRVEKARREGGLIGTMVNWGWNEMLGQNASNPRRPLDFLSDHADSSSVASEDGGSTVPQPEASQGLDYDERGGSPENSTAPRRPTSDGSINPSAATADIQEQGSTTNTWYAFLNYFRPHAGSKPRKESKKVKKIYKRGQTMNFDEEGSQSETNSPDPEQPVRRGPVRGSSLYTNRSDGEGLEAPPKTTVFESAGDLLSPPLPPKDFLLDPAARARTIFHDRVYHPDDIPPPPTKRQRTFSLFNGSKTDVSDTSAVPNQAHSDLVKISTSKKEGSEIGSMKIEEKIARAYHKDMAWRKVLVRLEPDAHNNMIVRRMFANAYGWPVVKHMCDTHFAFTAAAATRDDDEATKERAKEHSESAGKEGEEVKGQIDPPNDEQVRRDTESEPQEAATSAATNPDHKLEPTSSAGKKPSRQSSNTIMEHGRPRAGVQRTPSEIHESSDRVSDLISLVTATGQTGSSLSSMHSSSSPTITTAASASLHRLARQDSGRWSDRFFEGTDDETSDDEYDSTYGVRRIRETGEVDLTNNSSSVRGPSKGNALPPKHILDEQSTFVKEPDRMAVGEHTDSSIADSPTFNASTLSSAGVGLGVNAPEQSTRRSIDSERDPRVGIAEQIAVAQSRDESK